MSLNYGFGLYEYDETSRKNWNEKFNKLSKEDQNFYHNYLPWIMLFVDIHNVTEEMIPHISARLKAVNPGMYSDVCEKYTNKTKKGLDEYLKKFIGFSTNVLTISRKDFIKKITSRLEAEIPELKVKKRY
jgi:hypothetical protein